MNTNQEIKEEMYDYLLVVNPDIQISREVKQLKEQLVSVLGNYQGLHTPAHIALFRSEFPERFEDAFMDLLEGVAKTQGAFTVYTSRVAYFKQSDERHHLYVHVANPKPLVALHQSILQAFDLKPHTFQPHVMLARGLDAGDIYRVLPYFDNQVFVRSFSCQRFSLLKRPSGGGVYTYVRDFVFGDIEHMSGSLFNHAA